MSIYSPMLSRRVFVSYTVRDCEEAAHCRARVYSESSLPICWEGHTVTGWAIWPEEQVGYLGYVKHKVLSESMAYPQTPSLV